MSKREELKREIALLDAVDYGGFGCVATARNLLDLGDAVDSEIDKIYKDVHIIFTSVMKIIGEEVMSSWKNEQ